MLFMMVRAIFFIRWSTMSIKSLYIHIPFCDQICSYCDFPKVFAKHQNTDAYLDALIAELEIYAQTVDLKGLKTLYLGGGTPTALSTEQLDRLFCYLKSIISFDPLVEVSIEANPDSLNDDAKIESLRKNGVTRISLGVQTFNPNHLKILERTHSARDVCELISKLAIAGFEINVDMIYGIPTQTLADWEEDLEILLQLPITHVSAYSLILEPHTKFYLQYENDELDLVENEVEAQMFELVAGKLTHAGFDHYEISNFTRGNRSVHNETYWKNESYLGVGLGSHGKINGSRYENTRSINAYKRALSGSKLPILSVRLLKQDEHIEESMFLGLRMLEGVDLEQLSNKYQMDIYELYKPKIAKLESLGYVSWKSGVLRLTKKGLLMANEVFAEFLL